MQDGDDKRWETASAALRKRGYDDEAIQSLVSSWVAGILLSSAWTERFEPHESNTMIGGSLMSYIDHVTREDSHAAGEAISQHYFGEL